MRWPWSTAWDTPRAYRSTDCSTPPQWRKGFQRDADAYALTAQHPAYPALLHKAGIETAVVCGLASNICCFFVARDLVQEGFSVLLVEDASAGIDVPAAAFFQTKAREEGQALGIVYLQSADLLAAVNKTNLNPKALRR